MFSFSVVCLGSHSTFILCTASAAAFWFSDRLTLDAERRCELAESLDLVHYNGSSRLLIHVRIY